MKLIYTLKEFQLQSKYMKYSELENAIGEKFGIPSTLKKPEFKVTIEIDNLCKKGSHLLKT